jgi:uncharacterized protein with HEPN domain
LVFVWDAHRAASDVLSFVEGKSFDDYLGDKLLRSAVERQLMIVGEALSQCHKTDPSVVGSIATLSDIVGFRHVLVHGYSKLDHAVVWEVIARDLPPLRALLEAMLAKTPPEPLT